MQGGFPPLHFMLSIIFSNGSWANMSFCSSSISELLRSSDYWQNTSFETTSQAWVFNYFVGQTAGLVVVIRSHHMLPTTFVEKHTVQDKSCHPEGVAKVKKRAPREEHSNQTKQNTGQSQWNILEFFRLIQNQSRSLELSTALRSVARLMFNLASLLKKNKFQP